jgi:hypothetical protein
LQYWNGKKIEAHLEYTPKQTWSFLDYSLVISKFVLFNNLWWVKIHIKLSVAL